MLNIRLLFALTLIPASLTSEPLKLEVSAESAILINAENGRVLYEKNARSPQFPASVTKIATGIYALNRGGVSLDSVVTAENEALVSIAPEAKKRANYKLPPYWLESDGGHMGIRAGEQMTLRDLLYGLLVASANDAANVIAQYISGSIPRFMKDMNAYLKELGCADTHFSNPSGLHQPDHITTAYDLAILTKEALKNAEFRRMVSTVQYTKSKSNRQDAVTLIQTNRLLRKGPYYYSRAIGVKTGRTTVAQNCFVAAAEYKGRMLIAILLKERERDAMFQDAIRMFETAYAQPRVERIYVPQGPQRFAAKVGRAIKKVPTYLKEPLALQYYPAEEPKVQALLVWDSVEAPVDKHQRVGELRLVTPEGEILERQPLLASKQVRASPLYAIGDAVVVVPWVIWVLLGIVAVGLVSLYAHRRYRLLH